MPLPPVGGDFKFLVAVAPGPRHGPGAVRQLGIQEKLTFRVRCAGHVRIVGMCRAVNEVGGAVNVFHAVFAQIGADAALHLLMQGGPQLTKPGDVVPLAELCQADEAVKHMLLAASLAGQVPVSRLPGDGEALLVHGRRMKPASAAVGL